MKRRPMRTIERIAVSVLAMALWLLICSLNVRDGLMSVPDWPWVVVTAAIVAGCVWWATGKRERRGE